MPKSQLLGRFELHDEERAYDKILGTRLRNARERAEQLAAGKHPKRERGPKGVGDLPPEAFSQRGVARRLKRDQSWLSKIENGQRTISVGVVHQIARELGVQAAGLLADLTPPERASLEAMCREIAAQRKRLTAGSKRTSARQ